MKRSRMVLLAVLALAAGSARAAPPTVVPSPGYDARLQEQRAAAAASGQPAVPAPKPVSPAKRKRDRAR